MRVYECLVTELACLTNAMYNSILIVRWHRKANSEFESTRDKSSSRIRTRASHYSDVIMGLLPDTQIFALRMRRECRERLQRKPLVCDPGMHHGTCVTQVPWCMSGSLTSGGGENVPGIPGACATRNFAYLVRCPWARWRLKSPASWLFTQPFIQPQIKENIKVPRNCPLWGEFAGDRWIPLTKGQ